ncbi:hypothetical protein ABK040_012570 [Willaertia magna]
MKKLFYRNGICLSSSSSVFIHHHSHHYFHNIKQDIIHSNKLLNYYSINLFNNYNTIIDNNNHHTIINDSNNYNKTELVREFIHDSLYNPTYGYFNKNYNLIFSTNQSSIDNNIELLNNKELLNIEENKSFDNQRIIPFNQLKNKFEYLTYLSNLYKLEENSWGTPIEIFQPYYAIAIAEYILQQYSKNSNSKNDKLIIYEIGGGMGTCCKNILDYFENKYNNLYNLNLEYNIIEISKPLSLQQFKKNYKHIKNGKLNIYNESFLNFNKIENNNCFVIAMEVLDNCAHDKIAITRDGNVMECHVMVDRKINYYDEIYVDCKDSLILEYLNYIENDLTFNFNNNIFPYIDCKDIRKGIKIKEYLNKSTFYLRNILITLFGGETLQYIPTIQLLFLKKLKSNFPKHQFICADFDKLPNMNESGELNKPTVQKKFKFIDTLQLLKRMKEKKSFYLNDKEVLENNENYIIKSHDFRSYLVPKGECDIFFATDFNLLQKVYSQVCGINDKNNNDIQLRGSLVMSNAQFMERYAQLEKFETLDGYNPLLKDYSNFAFFLS